MDTTPTKQRVTIGALPACSGTFHQDVKGAILPGNAPFLFRLAAVIRRGGSAGEAMKKAREALIQSAINVVVYVTLSAILCAIFLMRHVHKWRNSEHLPTEQCWDHPQTAIGTAIWARRHILKI